jgi:hypothetical protein
VDNGSPAVLSEVNGASLVQTAVIAPGQVLTIHGRHPGGAVLLNGIPAEAIAVAQNEIRVACRTRWRAPRK